MRYFQFALSSCHNRMCVECMKEDYPDRDTTCLENGSYLMNYAGCVQCGNRGSISINNKQTTSDEETGDEVITYQHLCGECNHVIANHEYTFQVDDGYQIYEMQCALCGSGEDKRSIMPWDPRGPKD